MSLESYFRTCRDLVDREIDDRLPAPGGPASTVHAAMRHAVLGGGKRLRPILAIAACEACGGSPEVALDAAVALEFVHTYSLIHDDLPAMDDDDLRRGRPTVHRAFGEAEAILAGDALLTLAFEVLADGATSAELARRRIESVAVLARGAGVAGMVGGQIADLEAERTPPDRPGVDWIHRHKTGCLIAAAVEIGAIQAGAGASVRSAMVRYGTAVGLAFQIADDILDETATSEDLGKTAGKDARAGKATYPALIGLAASREAAEICIADAHAALDQAGVDSPILRSLAAYAVRRSR